MLGCASRILRWLCDCHPRASAKAGLVVHNATHEVTWRAMVVVMALMVDSDDAYGHGLRVGTRVVMVSIGFGLRRMLV